MKTARQVIQETAVEFMERGDIENLAHAMRPGSLTQAARNQVEHDLRIWEFGKWALLGDGSGQHIARQLKHQPRVKESPTFWQSIIPMNDDEGVEFDARMAKLLSKQEQSVIKCLYQYHQSEEAAARVLSLTRWTVKTLRDRALSILAD